MPQPVQCIVVHSVEAPARAGLAYSLATGWLQSAGVSVHAITDPSESVDMADLGTVAYHCGGGNQHSVGDEVTGYAAWSTAQWEDPTAFAALRLDAKKVAEQAKKLGIPLRWLKIAEIKAGLRGVITHNDARLAWGGTTHTDPGPGFPYDKFMQMCQQWAGQPVTAALNKTPNPQATGVGGAQPEDDDMALFFTYSEVSPRADGTYGSRVFISDGVFFRHVKDMEELAFEIYRLQQLGRTAQYVSDTKYARTDVPSGDPHAAAQVVAAAKWVLDPHVGGRDITEFLPKV